jgi:hypothetical protein
MKKKHKWQQIFCECPNCEKGEHIDCENCGQEKGSETKECE